jgi:hypothetical protein
MYVRLVDLRKATTIAAVLLGLDLSQKSIHDQFRCLPSFTGVLIFTLAFTWVLIGKACHNHKQLARPATQHQTEEVFSYFERHERTLVPIWEPTASPEFMPVHATRGGVARLQGGPSGPGELPFIRRVHEEDWRIFQDETIPPRHPQLSTCGASLEELC